MQTEGQSRHALPPGTVLNGVYRVEAELGQGGFGIVYRAHHTELDYPVAIKEYLPAELAIREGRSVHPRSADCREHFQEGMRRFLEEAKQLIAFRSHPNIVSCRDFFRGNGTAYLVMEYEEGLPLSELLRAREKEGRPFGEEDLRKVMVPLLEGLARVHAAGVLHRDIKPGNILVHREGERPVLIDFGAAKQNFAERSKSLAPFTEGYAAIEQVGEGKLGPWTDLYGAGAVMWRMVAGGERPYEPPNPVKVESRTHAVLRGESDPMPSARELGRGRFSERVLGAIDKCLELREADRVQDCGKLLGLLDAKRKRDEGRLKFTAADGTVWEGPLVDGQRQGHWVVRGANGNVWEGPFVDGKKHGDWVLRFANGNVWEGPYMDDKKHGRWVIRGADGTVGEGPFVDGNKHGDWVKREADGSVYDLSYMTGKQVSSVRRKGAPAGAESRPAEAEARPSRAARKSSKNWEFPAAALVMLAVVAFLGLILSDPRFRENPDRASSNQAQKMEYTVEDTRTGKSYTFMWDTKTPPTDADVDRIIAAQASSSPKIPLASPFRVEPEPKDARVRILNIKDRYRPGMKLPAGKYSVEVSAPGYETAVEVVNHRNTPTRRRIELMRVAEPDPVEPIVDTASFSLLPEPASARIVLLNSQESYRPGMALPPGNYRVEVSAPGYETAVEVVNHRNAPTRRRIELMRVAEPDPVEPIVDTASFSLLPEPASAKVVLLNSQERYRPGMKLPTGKYHVEVSAPGYEKMAEWIEHGNEPTRRRIRLKAIGVYFTRGSHQDDVMRLQGTPSSISRYSTFELWKYGFSSVKIDLQSKRVIEWNNLNGNLKVRMQPGRNTGGTSYFTRGSHQDDVLRLQGTPSSISRYSTFELWKYGFSSVKIDLQSKRVIEWNNLNGNLKVRMQPGRNTGGTSYFTRGSHQDDVLRLQGTPSSISRYSTFELWKYGFSSVKIDLQSKRVIEWNNLNGNLKVRMQPGRNTGGTSYFTRGSHQDDVLRLQGTPSSISRYSTFELWKYGFSSVKIDLQSKRVIEWNNLNGNLKVKMQPGR